MGLNGQELLVGMSYAHERYIQEAGTMMDMKNCRSGLRRVTRGLLIAAVISAMLASTVFAYVGFTRYENPMQMLKIFFGADGYAVDDGAVQEMTYYDLTWDAVWPTVEHVPVDSEVAAEIAPFISAVGESLQYEDYKLTVDAHQYDSATNCGVIYYFIENPNGLRGYEVQASGEVWWPGGELVNLRGASWKNYIIEGDTTDTKLSVASYYCDAEREKGIIEIRFFQEDDTLKLQLNDGGGMKTRVYQDSISVSPMAIRIHLPDFTFLGYHFEDGIYMPPVDDVKINYLALRFEDQTEYILLNRVEGQCIENTKYALINENADVFYVFNRLVDMDALSSVVINDEEFKIE